MGHQLSKSPETLQKEAEIKKLQKQLKKSRTTLKGLKTRLQNTKDDIENIQREVHVKLFSRLDDIQALREEIIELAKQLKNIKKINKDDRMALDQMIDDLIDGEMFGETFQHYQEQKEKHGPSGLENEEERRAKMQDLFAQFQVKPEASEQRDIRKIFLGLSKVFHPDRAKDKEEADHFHEMMQQINEAYQNNDVQTLIELENAYLHETLDLTTETTTIDTLQLQIDRLQRELEFIQNQIDRTSAEIKNLRESELGHLKSGLKKAERAGEGFDEMAAGFEEMVTLFTKMRDGLKDSISRGEMSPLLIDMMVDDAVEEATLQEFMEMMGLEGLEDLFEDFEDESFEREFGFNGYDELEVENPKFPIDSSVRIIKPIKSPYLKKIDMNGWEGRVIDVYYDEENQQKIIYEIAFDSLSMKQMPKALIEKAINKEEDFQTCALEEQFLKAAKPRDKEKDSIATYRQLFHEFTWVYLSPGQQKRLQKILLQKPSASDKDNWDLFFEKELKLPFQAQTRALLGTEEGIPVKVTDFVLYDEDYGHIVEVTLEGAREKREYPLVGLKGFLTNRKVAQTLDDYFEWGDEMIMGLI